MYNKTSILTRLIAIIIVISLVIPIGANASSVDIPAPYASSYLSSYNAYVYLAGNGLVQVYFSVTGTDYMDELGVLFIEIHESPDNVNWTWKTTFNHDTTSGLLSYDDNYHSGHVNYQGIDGYYYKAYVCVWGGKNGSGDARYFWTSVKP